jgi:hypothetical protein
MDRNPKVPTPMSGLVRFDTRLVPKATPSFKFIAEVSSLGYANSELGWCVSLPGDQKDRLRCYENALNNWRYEGYLEKKKRAWQWLRDEFAHYSSPEIRRIIFEHVKNGGRVHEVVETRESYVHNEFHYDLRIEIDHRRIYFETILLCDDPDHADDPRIIVVNVHDV